MTRWMLLVVAALVTLVPGRAASAESFAAHTDLIPFARMAVYTEGRVKSFDSHAASMMQLVSGSRGVAGQSPTFTYIDMLFRPDRYTSADVIYIKKKPMRSQIVDALRRSGSADVLPDFDARMDTFMEEGLISETLLTMPEVTTLIENWSRDLIRTAKFADQIDTARAVKDPRFLLTQMRIIPPANGATDVPWFNLSDLSEASEDPSMLAGMSVEQHARLMEASSDLFNAWHADENTTAPAEKAAMVDRAAAALADAVASISPEVYPAQNKLAWESWYFRAYNLTWIWVLYGFAIVPLLLSLVFRWSGARWLGLAMFMIAFGFHTFAVFLRWYVSGRWPNSNMFEAVTTSVWFGGCGAIVFEILVRRTQMRSVFALGSAVASMVALMCAWFMPLHLDAGIRNRMPVLHDVWLYIHTNVIIFSYVLIFMAAVTAVLYMLYRFGGRFMGFGSGKDDFARVGGAASLILSTPDGGTYMQKARTSIGQVLDGTTMILMELSFVLLWAGLVMGAIWADHSWGRPWGWDPKEVFALNTFIVFIVLVHGRFKVKDKGMWTAVIALIGAGVMLFNWIAINFVITGLHSYA